MAVQHCSYHMTGNMSLKGAVDAVDRHLRLKENMDTQQLSGTDASHIILQARANGGKLKQIVGMDKAITVRFNRNSRNDVIVEIGEAKWGDKAAVMATSMFILWPLAVTSGVGLYQQSRLPQKIKSVLDDYFCGNAGMEKLLEPVAKAGIYNTFNEAVNSSAGQKVVAKADRIIVALSKLIR